MQTPVKTFCNIDNLGSYLKCIKTNTLIAHHQTSETEAVGIIENNVTRLLFVALSFSAGFSHRKIERFNPIDRFIVMGRT